MNAVLRHTAPQNPAYNSMSGAFIASIIFHIVLVVVSAVGLPFVKKEPLIIDTPISVELVDIDELTRTNNISQPTPKPKEIETPKPPEAKPTPPKQTAEPPKPKEPEVVPEPVKKEKPKEKPKPKPKKKPKPKPKENDFQSLLKNLTPDADEKVQKKPKEEEGEKASGHVAPLAQQLSISELDALKYQIAQCWNVPSGVKYAENLAVEIRITINRDGTINQASVVDRGRYNRDSGFRAAADSAMRALRNPRCSPLKLPAEKYNQWKNTVMNFDPRDML